MNKKGPGTSPIAESGGFLYTKQGLSAPDIQLHFLPVMVVDHGRTEMRKDGVALAYVEMTLSCVKCHQHTRELRDARLRTAPDVFGGPRDVAAVLAPGGVGLP